jgi:nucleotide-binding universal stress UspA family protein
MPAMPRSIVVGVRSAETVDPALPIAAALSRSIGAQLHVVHALPPANTIDEARREPGGWRPCNGRTRTVTVRHRLEERIAEVGATDIATCHACAGAPAAVLSERARQLDAELIVVGPPSCDTVEAARFGPVARQVVRTATAPVLVPRSGRWTAPARVLIATDAGETAPPVVREGLRLCGLFGQRAPRIRLEFVAEREPLLVGPVEDKILAYLARQELRRFLAGIDTGGYDVEQHVRVGEVAEEVLYAAAEWNAELLVVGVHEVHGLTQLLLGRTPVTTANVVVVPPGLAAQPDAVEDGVGGAAIVREPRDRRGVLVPA